MELKVEVMTKISLSRSKAEKMRDRDISEKIALGLPDARKAASGTQFDQRLFNQSKGMVWPSQT